MIQDICIGNVLQPGAGAFMGRVAMLQAGFQDRTSVYGGIYYWYIIFIYKILVYNIDI